tara:strand:- start:152 stop:460 length:309 start_codon:yes stop_codon:yes gene_type:complete
MKVIPKIEYNGETHWNVSINGEHSNLPIEVIQKALLDEAWHLVRNKRDSLLRECDYAIMPDYPLTDAEKAAVTAYRQALRDIPETFASPDSVEWPAKPEALA